MPVATTIPLAIILTVLLVAGIAIGYLERQPLWAVGTTIAVAAIAAYVWYG